MSAIANVALRVVTGQWHHLIYAASNRLRGLDLSFESVEGAGLSPERAHYHAHSGGPDLAKVFKRLGVPPGSRAIDLGSGKGGAVLTMCDCGFEEVAGVELSERLHGIAVANLKRAGQSATLMCQDATTLAGPALDRFTHVYMFNPFPAAVVRVVLGNVLESLARSPRKLTLILKWPDDGPASIMDGLPFKALSVMRFPNSHPFYIYGSGHGWMPAPAL